MSFNFVIYFFNKQGCFQLINILYIFKTESLLLTHISSKIFQPKQQTFQKTTFPNIKNYTHATFTQCHAVFTTKEHTHTHTLDRNICFNTFFPWKPSISCVYRSSEIMRHQRTFHSSCLSLGSTLCLHSTKSAHLRNETKQNKQTPMPWARSPWLTQNWTETLV